MPRHGNNIRKRMDGRWEGRYKYLCDDNTYKYKSVYGKTCREVKEKLEKVILQQNQMVLVTDAGSAYNEIKSETFEKMAVDWLESIKETRKYSTYVKYRNIYDTHIRNTVGKASIHNISNSFVNENVFSEKTKLSPNLKHSIVAVINQILKFAAENYDYPMIQLSNKFAKDRGRKIEVINHTEQATLLRYLYQEIDASKAGILLCIFTGLRLGEICALKWEDIDFEQLIIHVNRTVQRIPIEGVKNKTVLMVTDPKSVFSIREIPISMKTAQILENIKHDGEYVVGGSKPLDPRTYQNRFKSYLREITIKDYNFHALRHTFATNCIDNDMDIKSLSEILGHANVQITLDRYVHPSMAAKRRQIAILDSVYGQFCGENE